MSKLKFSKIKKLEVNSKKADVYGSQQLNLTAFYDGIYLKKKSIYYYFVSQCPFYNSGSQPGGHDPFGVE